MPTIPALISVKSNQPDFLDLPWSIPLAEWQKSTERLVEVPRGLSRHPVVFVHYDSGVYALKELPVDVAEKEYNLLNQMFNDRLPVVKPFGFIKLNNSWGNTSILITHYLEFSQPYRSLIIGSSMERLKENFLDAMAGLLVQLHLAGVFWGDCSLSNTLFRRDAGTLQAYLVDAETAEIKQELPADLRFEDLKIMEENVSGDLADLAASRLLPPNFMIFEIAPSIHRRYLRLWDEINREEVIAPNERFRIQERIRALNELGFSVGELEIQATDAGDQLRMRAMVTDRNFHRDRLHSLTGLDAEEQQARKMMNEIQELNATLVKENNRSTPVGIAAYQWLERIYQPAIQKLQPLIERNKADPAELYCQVLEHKWYLSEKAKHDVGHDTTIRDYLDNFGR